MPDTKPCFTHDCDACVYLGTHLYRDRPQDLYFCPTEPFKGTVVARSDSDGPEYTSMSLYHMLYSDLTEILLVAKGAAIDAHLVDYGPEYMHDSIPLSWARLQEMAEALGWDD